MRQENGLGRCAALRTMSVICGVLFFFPSIAYSRMAQDTGSSSEGIYEHSPQKDVFGPGHIHPLILRHQLNRNKNGRAIPRDMGSRDVGDIAVMVNDPEAEFPMITQPLGKAFNLTGKEVSFRPGAHGHSYQVVVEEIAGPSGVDDELNTALDHNIIDEGICEAQDIKCVAAYSNDDASANLGEQLPIAGPGDFVFPYMGRSYSLDQIFVNVNGSITFGRPQSFSGNDLRDKTAVFFGAPRISGFHADLNANPDSCFSTTEAGFQCGRGLVAAQLVDNYNNSGQGALSVGWFGVAEFGSNLDVNFRIILKSDGEIVFRYGPISLPVVRDPSGAPNVFAGILPFGHVGIFEGAVDRPPTEQPLNEEDFHSLTTPGLYEVGAVFQTFYADAFKFVDFIALTQRFYSTHADKYDYLVVFTDFMEGSALHGIAAFQISTRNDTYGLGLFLRSFPPEFGPDLFNYNHLWGSGNGGGKPGGELESIVMMGDRRKFWPDPHRLVDPPTGTIDASSFPLLYGSDTSSTNLFRFITSNSNLEKHSAMSLLNHEVFHRYGFNVAFCTEDGCFADLWKGFADSSHASFFFNTESSGFPGEARTGTLGGNALIDCGTAGSPNPDPACTNGVVDARVCDSPGERAFVTKTQLQDGNDKLNQYLMGLIPVHEVGDFWYVKEPRKIYDSVCLDPPDCTFVMDGPMPWDSLSGLAASDNVFFCGKRVDLSTENVIAFHGPRGHSGGVPLGDEIDTDHRTGKPLPTMDANGNSLNPDIKTMAFILLVEQWPTGTGLDNLIVQTDNLRKTWEWYANTRATNGKGQFNTRLNPPIY